MVLARNLMDLEISTAFFGCTPMVAICVSYIMSVADVI